MSHVATVRTALVMCGAVICAVAPACKRPDPGPALQIVDETLRLRPDDPVPVSSPVFDGSAVRLVAARGETLGIQVIHRGGGPVTLAIAGVRIQAFDVARAIVRVASSDLYGGSRGAGAYPDELVATSTPTTDPAFFELAADGAGPHEGELVVGGRRIPVTLTVAPVALPSLAIGVWAYYDPRELILAHLGAGTLEAPSTEERRCIAMFRDHGVLLSPDLPVSAWSARRTLLSGLPDVPVRISDDPVRAADDVHAWIEATRNTGQVPFAIPIDEPSTPEARAKLGVLAAAVRAAGGGPGRFRFAVTDEPRPEYGDLVDLYITLRAKLADRFARWTYNGAPPRAGSVVVDGEPPGMRTWGWIGWRWRIPIWYVWDALYWHDRYHQRTALDAHVDATSFEGGGERGNLDGVLAMPGDATTPCRPTLRLAALRRGLEDRALLELAATCDAAATAKLAEQMVPRALGDADGKVSWPTDEAAWEAGRRKLIDLASCQR